MRSWLQGPFTFVLGSSILFSVKLLILD